MNPNRIMPENVRLQNLRDFTVQIRDPETSEIKGTGIVISPDHVITCAHVVEAVLGVEAKDAADRKIGVYFPLLSSTETKTRHAIVTGCPAQHDDDIVTLRLIDGSAPLGPEQIAELGSAEHSEGHEFLSYGYSPTLEYPGTRADGHILGSVEPPAGKILHADPIQISSQQIDYGMSGAAVLDTKLNLVVGLVAARYFPKTWAKGDIAYAVDAKVLTFDPFYFKLREEALPLRPAPVVRIDVYEAISSSRNDLDLAWNNAPQFIQEWVGRADLLKAITNDWINSKIRVTGLIGFGGEGKSSLARRWIDELLKDTELPRPDGIFWWGFYDRPSVDEFFEAALNYLSGGNTELARLYSSSSARVHLLAGMLHGGRYLFILDGLEVLQHQEGDQFGLLKSNDLREFLHFFAAPNHNSFCIITSRVPLLDMMEYTTYQHRDVERLSAADGRALLQILGVKGSDTELDRVVVDWDGHALTLTLIGSYIADQYGGDIKHIKDLPTTAGEPRYTRVHRILMRYDEHLREEGRAFLKILSAFRIPVDKTAFNEVFRTDLKEKMDKEIAINAPIAALDDAAFEVMVKLLADYRILRYDILTGKYNTHPLIRMHYAEILSKCDKEQLRVLHLCIKNYYLPKIIPHIPYKPVLRDIELFTEAIYHACCAGSHDLGYRIFWDYVFQCERRVLIMILAAWDTHLSIMLNFFPEGDFSGEPLVSDPIIKDVILNEVGLSLMCLGRLSEAIQVLNHSISLSKNIDDKLNASISLSNSSHVYLHLGLFGKSIEAASKSLHFAVSSMFYEEVRNAMAYLARANYLRGRLQLAEKWFRRSEYLEHLLDSEEKYLYSTRGIWYAESLLRKGSLKKARKVIKRNLLLSNTYGWPVMICQSLRLMGDLMAIHGNYDESLRYYNLSLEKSRKIPDKSTQIEALLAKGRFIYKYKHKYNIDSLQIDLREALNHAIQGGYRVYEADIRVGLAWAHLALGDRDAAMKEANYAKQVSTEMGYYWGKKDADEVLTEIEKA